MKSFVFLVLSIVFSFQQVHANTDESTHLHFYCQLDPGVYPKEQGVYGSVDFVGTELSASVDYVQADPEFSILMKNQTASFQHVYIRTLDDPSAYLFSLDVVYFDGYNMNRVSVNFEKSDLENVIAEQNVATQSFSLNRYSRCSYLYGPYQYPSEEFLLRVMKNHHTGY